jgi:hypothetical protein
MICHVYKTEYKYRYNTETCLRYKDGVSKISALPGCGHWSANMKSCDHKRTLQKRETTKRWRHKQKLFLKLFDLFPTRKFPSSERCGHLLQYGRNNKTRECCPPCILSKYQSPLLVITTVPSRQTVLGSVVQKAGEVCTCPRPAVGGATEDSRRHTDRVQCR